MTPNGIAIAGKSPVIFLDMDGVISTARAHKARAGDIWPDRWIDAEAVANLNDLCARSGAIVVVSSTWRLNHDGGEFLTILNRNGFTGTIHDDWRTKSLITAVPGSSLVAATMRGEEVLEWLSRHPEVTRHVILDDDSDFLPDQPLIKTPFETGLSVGHVEVALALLAALP